jgi:UDP-galactopyranose mutase
VGALKEERGARKQTDGMPAGPFGSTSGVGRADAPWDELNLVKTTVGEDAIAKSATSNGRDPEATPEEALAMVGRGEDGLSEETYDVIIVGAGLSGATMAERLSKELDKKVLIIEKRDHIGGNCYDYVTENGIRASKYGAHLFHTKHERVWEYVRRFSEWVPFDHRVRGRVKPTPESTEELLVPIPPTQETVNALFGAGVKSEEDMEAWYAKERVFPEHGGELANGEEAALSRVGPRLYEAIFKHYTKKQWDKYPAELDASVLMRLPCRTSTDDRYFSDPWQALPKHGYTRIFENMIGNDPNITVRVDCDFFEMKKKGTLPKHEFLVYTGQIDSYYAALGMPQLEYRSLRFEEEYVEKTEDGEFFQEAMVVNYPSSDVPFTRIVEYKHTPNQPAGRHEAPGTLIAREYSSATGEPYYPVPNPENRALYEKYAEMAAKEPGVAFVGRLASYKYFNMDEAILNALEMFDNLVETGKLEPKRAIPK